MNGIKELLEQKKASSNFLSEKLEKNCSLINSYAKNRIQLTIEILFKTAGKLQV
jgi:ribosome-binding protein aMBF1 (putative translation factor)